MPSGNDFRKKTPAVNSSKPTVKKVERGKAQENKISDESNSKFLIKLAGNITNPQAYQGCSTTEIMNLDLGISKVKNLYRSFDGALMGSTIANIDI